MNSLSFHNKVKNKCIKKSKHWSKDLWHLHNVNLFLHKYANDNCLWTLWTMTRWWLCFFFLSWYLRLLTMIKSNFKKLDEVFINLTNAFHLIELFKLCCIWTNTCMKKHSRSSLTKELFKMTKSLNSAYEGVQFLASY